MTLHERLLDDFFVVDRGLENLARLEGQDLADDALLPHDRLAVSRGSWPCGRGRNSTAL